MELFNPPVELGGENIKEPSVGIKIDTGTNLSVDKDMGLELLEKYPFLKEIDETYSPDYYETLIRKPWYKRLCHYVTSINPFGTQ